MISRRRVLVFGVGGLIVAMVTPFWRKFACEHSSDSSSSPIVFKFGMEVRYGKSKTPIGFWCGRSHRCHGNPIFCGNFLVSALAAVVFLRSSSNLAWRCITGKTKRPIVFGSGWSHCCHGNDIFVKFCSFYPIDWHKIWHTGFHDGGWGTGRGIHVLGHRVL